MIPKLIDQIAEKIAAKTKNFVGTKAGKIFLFLVCLGPLTFIPTIWMAYTAPNIDALRTMTWPLMLIVNTSALLGVVHNGDWRIRLTMAMWMIACAAIWIAVLVR